MMTMQKDISPIVCSPRALSEWTASETGQLPLMSQYNQFSVASRNNRVAANLPQNLLLHLLLLLLLPLLLLLVLLLIYYLHCPKNTDAFTIFHTHLHMTCAHTFRYIYDFIRHVVVAHMLSIYIFIYIWKIYKSNTTNEQLASKQWTNYNRISTWIYL